MDSTQYKEELVDYKTQSITGACALFGPMPCDFRIQSVFQLNESYSSELLKFCFKGTLS
jgi:hypothetical protein